MKIIKNIDQLRAEQLRRSLKRAKLEAHLYHQWKLLQHQPPRLVSLLDWILPSLASRFLKRKRRWFDYFR